MGVHDLWYLTKDKKGSDGERLKSASYGRGKRWRVRYTDATGEEHNRLFSRKADAEAFDAACRTGAAPETKLDQGERNVTFPAYADRWRTARNITWGLETRRRIEGNVPLHLNPAFPGTFRAVTQTDVLLWLTGKLADGVEQSSVRLYFELFDTICAAAVLDGVLELNPCAGIKISQVFRGLSRAPKWVPNEDQVLKLFDVVPDRYQALLWLGAGEGVRISEALGMEDGPRCVDPEHEELHVVQQLGYAPSEYDGGFHLRLPKGVKVFDPAGGPVDLDPVVAKAVDWHRREYPAVEVEMLDLTPGRPIRRRVPLLFTTVHGNPFTDRTWSAEWVKWRRLAGWPEDPNNSGFRALRHFFATTLIRNHVDPKDVQRALRHSTLQITLETYVHWWPRAERRKSILGEVLKTAVGDRWELS
jgi:integrase